MKYMDKGIVAIHEALKKGEITSQELVEESLTKAHEIQDKTNAFVTILDDAKGLPVTDDLLSGIPYGIKDNYSTRGILSTGSSNTLKNYIPFFSATAVLNLEKKGAVPIGKTTLDEFGMGGTGTTAHTGIVHNLCCRGSLSICSRLRYRRLHSKTSCILWNSRLQTNLRNDFSIWIISFRIFT